MGKPPAAFTRSAVQSAVKAVLGAGLPVQRVEVGQDGKIVVIAGAPSAVSVPPHEENGLVNPWDSVLSDAAHKERTS